MPARLAKLKATLERGLSQTAQLWPQVRRAFGYVHRAAHILGNHDQADAAGVRRSYQEPVRALGREAPEAGPLRPSLEHFLKVTASYEPGLFHCYDLADLPRTNNGLEQPFGSTRHHERRCTGRKSASPSLVLRGSVRVIAAVATRARRYTGRQLAPRDPAAWAQVHRQLEARREARVQRCRFRRDPDAYLRQLEEQLLKPPLPP